MPNTLTPNPADAFSRFFAAAFDEKSVVSVPTAFQAFFGRREAGGSQTFWTEDALTVDIDIIRAEGETHAALVHRGTDSRRLGSDKKSLNVEKYTAESRVFPLIEDEGELAASKLLLRNAGENPYSRMSRLNRMRDRAMKIYEESIRRIMRAREVLAAESILTGKQSAIFGTASTDLQYDFKRTAALNWTVSVDWSTITTDIIDTACTLVRQNGFVWPNFMGLGSTAMRSLIKNTEALALADNRRFELIWVSQNMPVPDKYARFINAGWKARGLLRTPDGNELWMFTNNEYYTSLAGSQTKYLPDTKVIV
ncbi:MAG: major capsid protein, partial [Planctomycetota bacterium]